MLHSAQKKKMPFPVSKLCTAIFSVWLTHSHKVKQFYYSFAVLNYLLVIDLSKTLSDFAMAVTKD